MSGYRTIVVLGGGSWGTALALTAARAGREAILWARDADVVAAIRSRQQNPAYLPSITFDEVLEATTDLAAVSRADAVLLVTPAQTTRSMLAAIRPHLKPGTPVVLCAKGIERGTGKLLTEILEDELPQAHPAVLSGPSFAEDVARGLPTAVTVAARDGAVADALAQALAAPSFRPYASTDLVGVQVGGALKNVLAIACGAVVGRRLGASAQAALTARGFAELSRLGAAMGARPETLTGLSGLGDLVLTCSSPQSRNFSFGLHLGEGRPVGDLVTLGGKLAEGVHTARIAVELGRRHKVSLPICETVAAVLDGTLTVDDALTALMSRPLKREAEQS
ncbi:NAD(P)H-dependent glycerol-3-phosphate dehydrogenase [Polymorphum gilvum]|uniref:Glycerol-3-phosphate dehydrogenase [NAD(P)+] n=1 Tax=Polymorphum gilvum (strain LMG 25793 / CGMCC 1.9160 / SL003B-26A1) TaxID=991905 RepID=F2J248_POLGS|nr:NAD(P)H-dependent glycerol-3-phosphate dehydrogenase [Polymorphum gilvum]ADZ68808.1 Glycerol-3-phosphate dehydrogenase [NAD(P)+] [Polymorphum gilvum SL003B-26A1]